VGRKDSIMSTAVLPERITLRRTKGFRLPEDAVRVVRPGRWGNPFSYERAHDPRWDWIVVWCGLGMGFGRPRPEDWNSIECADWSETQRELVSAFDRWITDPDQADLAEIVRERLRGKPLACWCKQDEPCHADVLLRIANE
jgi:hypothetical protein